MFRAEPGKVSADPDHINISEALARGIGKIAYCDGHCLFVRAGDICLAAVKDAQGAVRVRELIQPGDILSVNGYDIDQAWAAKRWPGAYTDYNYLYPEPDPPGVKLPVGVMIRELRTNDLDYVCANYATVPDREYLSGRITEGMLGIEESGRLCGFIGTQDEGAMGILWVAPECRGRRYGFFLEAEEIRRTLAKGQIPFCQVNEGNRASEALQRRLRMAKSRHPVRWYF